MGVAGWKRDHAPRASILIDTLHDARALTSESLRWKRSISFLRHRCPDVVECIREVRSPRLAGVALLEVRAVGRSDVEVEQISMSRSSDKCGWLIQPTSSPPLLHPRPGCPTRRRMLPRVCPPVRGEELRSLRTARNRWTRTVASLSPRA